MAEAEAELFNAKAQRTQRNAEKSEIIEFGIARREPVEREKGAASAALSFVGGKTGASLGLELYCFALTLRSFAFFAPSR